MAIVISIVWSIFIFLSAFIFFVLPKKYSWARLGISLSAAHSIAVIFSSVLQINGADNAQAEFGWFYFLFLDFPVVSPFMILRDGFQHFTDLIFASNGLSKLVAIAMSLLISGGLFYGIIGLILGRIIHTWPRRRKKAG
jgi:hypothetical protein